MMRLCWSLVATRHRRLAATGYPLADGERLLPVAAKQALLFLVSIVMIASSAFAADEHLPAVTTLSFGFDGQYKLGCWTPLKVTVRGVSESVHGQLCVELPDGDGVGVRYLSETINLPAGEEHDVLWYVKVGRLVNDVTIRMRYSGEQSSRLKSLRTFPLRPPLDLDTRLVLNLGPAICSPESLAAFNTVLVQLDDCGQLPERWIGYEAVHALVLTTSRPELLGQLTDDTGQYLAVEDWLEAGGRVVICDGTNGQTLLGPDSPLGRFLPGKLGEPVPWPRFDALEAYSGSKERITASRQTSPQLAVPRLQEVHGTIEAAEGDLPLVVRSLRGLGEVTYLAVALDQSPLATWSGRTPMAARLLGVERHESSSTSESPVADRARTYGIADLSGQLYAAIDQFDGVRSVAFWMLGALALAYVVAIGPLDYWFVGRVLRRPELTWLTLPVLIAAPVFAIGAVDVAFKGTTERINQVDVIDIDLDRNIQRGTSWLAIFTPEADRYDLCVHHCSQSGSSVISNEAISWFAPPGEGWGGMHSSAASAHAMAEPYTADYPLEHLRSVAIEAANTKAFCARWTGPAPSTIEATLRKTADGGLEGSIENQQAGMLDDAILLFGRFGYSLGSIAAGAKIDIPREDRRDLDVVLKRFQVVRNQQNNNYMQAPLPYDPASLELPSVVQTMMFYEALGGRQYTGIPDDQQGFVDLSSVIRQGRAVLVARISEDDRLGSSWHNHGDAFDPQQLQSWKYCRIVMPVQP